MERIQLTIAIVRNSILIMDIFSKPSRTASNWHNNSPDSRDTIIRKQKKEGILMDNITSKVYNHMKLSQDQDEFVPTVRKTAD